ncbi:S41 family peptidase [Armatimonas rosea]|uniref:Tricorn protease homolog n=1 Tax=Armatimonas rosea TaxID=685828 RepID=A0A7W9SLU2_ARMRO|nr:S41 family peptidase [Armatimonas rosea]MBB6048293.1 tricorn protease [Armatimonas rosea]
MIIPAPFFLATLALSQPMQAAPRGYFRTPSLRGETVVFAAEGDLWRVAVGGGGATRLTTHPSEESNPALSPDGKWVAFSASYEGPDEVYVMPSTGGEPTRLTFGAGGTVAGWTKDGKILYATGKHSSLPSTQLVALDPNTKQRTRIPLAQASDGVYDDVGNLFFTRFDFQGSQTKRYQGGTAQNLWKLAPGATEAVALTADFKGTSRNPMVWKDRVYFLSDRDGIMNVWSMDTNGKSVKQVTHETGFDVQNPQLDTTTGKLIYQHGADLYVADAATGTSTKLGITLSSDFDQLRERWITRPLDWVTAAHLSPSGDKLVLTARGQVFVVPTGKTGRIVEATRKPGVRYREARFLPDGKGLVALSDESGEVELWKLPPTGEVTAPREQLTKDGQVLRWDTTPSPDGKWIAHTDKFNRLHLYDATAKTTKVIATSDDGGIGSVTFSPDSRYIAFSFPCANSFSQLRLYDIKTGKTTELTTDRYDCSDPAFSPDGKFLYFLSDRSFNSKVGSPWGPRQPEPFFENQTQVFALSLQPGNRSPFLPENELDAEKKAEEKKPEEKKPDEKKPEPGLPAIVTEGIATRLSLVPVPAGSYGNLKTDGKKLFLTANTDSGTHLMAIVIRSEDIKLDTLVTGIGSYELSADSKKLLVGQNNAYLVFDASGGPDPARSRVSLLDRWSFSLDPKEEWKQMYDEAWRLHRDYFYDPKLHNVDWPALREKYRPLAARIACRADLSDVLAQLMGELSVLHTFVYGGDQRGGTDSVGVATLGAEWEKDEAKGGWRITRLWRTDPDMPEKLGPLLKPGVEASEGDVIAQINGVPTLSLDDPAQLLRAQTNKQVRLKLFPGGDSSKARDVIVTAISGGQEWDLRYSDWEFTRRQAVEKAAPGKLGYVHLRAMGSGDIAQWEREFYPVFNRDGLIIDVRHNNGGNIDSWILEKLARKAWMFWKAPVGAPTWNMQYAFRGKVVVLCDESTASDGEAFAEGFKRLGLGKVIGTRTWGGEVWLTSSNTLVDRGIATAAEFGVFGPEGNWLIEGHGVEPDIVVDNLPRATYDGKDAQLDAAIQHLLKELAKNPVPKIKVPPYPDKSFPKRR